MIIASDNHNESIILSIYYLHENWQSVDISAVTNYWAVENRWKRSPIHKVMGLVYSLTVTCRNESNTW